MRGYLAFFFLDDFCCRNIGSFLIKSQKIHIQQFTYTGVNDILNLLNQRKRGLPIKKANQLSEAAFQLDGKMPLKQAIPLGLQHVLAMFVGNLTPLLIITGTCGIANGEFAELQLHLLQNAMLVAGIVTLIQLFSIGPIGGNVPIVMGTSSGFLGVFNSVAATMGGGVIAYGAIMGASIIGGLFEGVLGFFLKPLRKFFPAVVTGTVVMVLPRAFSLWNLSSVNWRRSWVCRAAVSPMLT